MLKASLRLRPSSPWTILLIDSYKEDREYWAHRLAMASPDYVVLEADTGEAGLAICRWRRVDCVLVELHLPDISGFQVLINLVPRARHPEIPVIVLTRLALYPMGDLALANGAQAFLLKSQSSGDALNITIQEAIAKVPRRECGFGELH
jgi:DNA-binding NarL/FixJ family response regulator